MEDRKSRKTKSVQFAINLTKDTWSNTPNHPLDLIMHNYKPRIYFVILKDAKQTQQHSSPQEPSREILEKMFHM